MNPNRALTAAFAALCLLVSVAVTHADPGQTRLGWRPSPNFWPELVSAFSSHSLLVWRDDSTARCTMVDDAGRLAPGWVAEGIELESAAGEPSQPEILKLSDSLVVAAWTRSGANGRNVFAAMFAGNAGGVPAAAEVSIDSVTDRAGGQSLACLVKQDEAHVLVLVNDVGAGTSTLIRQLSRPGTPQSDWPAGGVVLSDTLLGTRIVSGCDDGGLGCFVLLARDSAAQPQLRILHLLPDGSEDPAWPSGSVVSRDQYVIKSRTHLLSDRAGGVYFIGWSDVAAPVGKRFGPDGSLQPGWPAQGIELIPAPSGYSVAIADGPQYAVSSTGRLVGLAQLVDLSFQQRGVAAMSHEPDGTVTPGWPATGLQYPAGITTSGSPQLCLTPADEVVLTWSDHGPAPNGPGALMGVALSPEGDELAGWPTSHVLRATQRNLAYNRSSLGADGAFSQLWLEFGGLEEDSTHFARFQIADGAVPTLAAARLLEQTFTQRRLRATWLLEGVPDLRLDLVRSLDHAPFAALPVLTWQGASIVGFEDELPSGSLEARYLLVSTHDGIRRAVSDTLRVSAPEPAQQIQIVGERIQRGNELAFTIELASGAAPVEVSLFDVAGRRLQRQRLAFAGQGPQSVLLPLERRAPGIHLVEARLSDGNAAVTRFVVLP